MDAVQIIWRQIPGKQKYSSVPKSFPSFSLTQIIVDMRCFFVSRRDRFLQQVSIFFFNFENLILFLCILQL